MDEDKPVIDKQLEEDVDLVPSDTVSEVPEDSDLVLTTIDNPHNPKDDYAKWKQWDEESGYNTEAYVARLLMMEKDFDIDDELSIVELTNKVINDILLNDPLNVYALV